LKMVRILSFGPSRRFSRSCTSRAW
jgi:hypothetical protein